jgi:chromosome segregation ATPase
MSDGVNNVGGLRNAFEESAANDMRTVQELERNLDEVTDYVGGIERFFHKKLSEIRDLRTSISDTATGRVKSGYSVAKDAIRELENKVKAQEKEILRLKENISRKDIQLTDATRRCVDEVDAVPKQIFTAINQQASEWREGSEEANDSNPTGNTVHHKDEMTSCLNEELNRLKKDAEEKSIKICILDAVIKQKDRELEQLGRSRAELELSLSEKEKEHLVNKRLNNIKKIRQLETLAKKSIEIEELVNKLRHETANIADRLADRNNCQAISPAAASTEAAAKRPSGLSG